MIELNSDRWSNILTAGFGARVISVGTSRIILVTIFRAGPFRVAYPDFPVGAFNYGQEDLDTILDICQTERVDVVRVHVQTQPAGLRADAVQSLGTIQIVNLQDWEENAQEKSRRTRNRIARSEVKITKSRRFDGERLYELYVGTITRNAGRTRYTRAYFDEIAETGCLIAKAEDRIIGFVCLGIHEGRACYLHGGYDSQARYLYPSDLLFRAMILEARNAGARVFDFLPSPADQHTLNRYKIAWGGVQSSFVVIDTHLNPIRAKAFHYLRSVMDRLPKVVLDLLPLREKANQRLS